MKNNNTQFKTLKQDMYIIKKLQDIKKDNKLNKITNEEKNLILEIIKQELETEKNNIIEKYITNIYSNKRITFFSKNIKKYIEHYTDIINCLENLLKNKYNIENNYSFYYCISYISDFINASF